MKTKFVNIPKDQRINSWKRTLTSLIYWKENHSSHVGKLERAPDMYIYKFNDHNRLHYWDSGTVDFYHKVSDDQAIVLNVTSKQWVKDLFNQLYNAKASAAN